MLARFGMMLICNVVGITLYRPLDERCDADCRDCRLRPPPPSIPPPCPHAGITVRAHAAPVATAWSFCHFFDIVSGL